MRCWLGGPLFVAVVSVQGGPVMAGPPSPLTDADRALFAWFDGIGLPSCAGKPYVRIEWTRVGASESVPSADDTWSVDGFVVAEDADRLTVLDGDLWPRRIERRPPSGWKGGVRTLDLRAVVTAALARLRAMRTDPGAVEGIDELYRGVRLRFGDEAQTTALARHAALNRLEREAQALLEAARALPPASGGVAVPFEQVVQRQLDEGVLWRIHVDFAEADIGRNRLLERLRGWRTSFPASPHLARADALLEVLPAMVQDDAAHRPMPDAEFAGRSATGRARELVRRLRDQTGDVVMLRGRRVSLELGEPSSPARQLEAMGLAAAPALVDALTDAALTRAVLFRGDFEFRRIAIARVGDFARVLLEQLADRSFWTVPEDAPSMFQHGAQAEVAEQGRAWLATAVTTPNGAPK